MKFYLRLLHSLEKLLKEKYEISNVVYKRKPTASIPADDDIIEELARNVHAVIVGLAD